VRLRLDSPLRDYLTSIFRRQELANSYGATMGLRNWIGDGEGGRHYDYLISARKSQRTSITAFLLAVNVPPPHPAEVDAACHGLRDFTPREFAEGSRAKSTDQESFMLAVAVSW
jgi:hypothetical protein